MKLIEMGGLKARVAGGVDREGSGSGPMVVLCHGFGAPGDDLASLWRVIPAPPGTRFIFPEAPLSLGAGYGNGRAWWHIDMMALQLRMARGEMRDFPNEVPDGLGAAREGLRELLDSLDATLGAPTDGGLFLGGFSQGAMLALDVALHDARPLAGVVLLSGTLIAERVWQPLLASRAHLRVFQSHGREDPILPFDLAERLHATLREAGLDVTFHPFRGGHGIGPDVIDALSGWLASA